MSRPELIQCVLDIKSWFMRTKCSRRIKDGATSVDFQRLNKAMGSEIPEQLEVLLGEVNGGIYFMEKEQMSTEMVMDIITNLSGSKMWKQGLVPFCGDENALLAIDTEGDCEIVEWDSDDGVGDVVAANLSSFLEQYRNNLLSGQFEFLDDAGVIEKMARSKK